MIILLFVFYFLSLARGDCPSGSFSQSGKCLELHTNTSVFHAAEVVCLHRGGHLVSIQNSFLNSFLYSQAKAEGITGYMYIGAFASNNDYQWTDGSPMGYLIFAPGTQPQGCVVMSMADSLWHTVDCSTELPYACQVADTFDYVCKPEWTAFHGNCYLYVQPQTSVSWTLASKGCNGVAAELTSIHSHEENNFLAGFARPTGDCSRTWIGLYYDIRYFWSDGTRVDYNNATECEVSPPIAYYIWPNCKGKWAGWWDDWNVDRETPSYICKKGATPPLPPSLLERKEKKIQLTEKIGAEKTPSQR